VDGATFAERQERQAQLEEELAKRQPAPPPPLERALRAGNAADVERILAAPPLDGDDAPGMFVPIRERGGGSALAACFPDGWGVLELDREYWALLYKTTKSYVDHQIECAGISRDRLEAQAAELQRLKASYEQASKSVDTDANFKAVVELLDGVVERIDARNDGVKAVQRSADLLVVFRDARDVEAKFTTLMKTLGEITQCPCEKAPCKKVFRCLEKMGLDGEQPWDARSLTDVVRGTVTVTSMAAGRQLILLLMAADREVDRPEAEHSPSKDTVGEEIILALGGDSIVIVGVKNRWKHAVNGWRDAQIKFYFRSDPNKHVCELQLSHQLLANVRKGMGMHKVYAKSRNAVELLEASVAALPTSTFRAATSR
jgi:hypothetical protein